MSSAPPFSVLVVDDEPDLRTLYELTLLREGYDIETAATVEDALLLLKDRSFSAVITDMRLPDGSGLDLLRKLEETGRSEKAIVITAYGSAENAVEALKAGAFDYLTKPVDLRQFRAIVASAIGRLPHAVPSIDPANLPSSKSAAAVAPVRVARPVASTAPSASMLAASAAALGNAALDRLAGQSAAMRDVRELVEKVARSMAPVLVHGESGTGKELVARAIHDVSPRASQPFIPVNCGAIPEQLLEAEFFGYRKGAFTGAHDDRGGFFQAANGGTLFLDEIGDLPLAMQSKLLRVIQERSVRQIGAVNEQPINVRIISATHKDLEAEVPAGRFRQDLYYRLNVIRIRVPPLRERIGDVPAISERVLALIAREAGVAVPPRLTPAALGHLARYAFPGNVRELENLLHRAVALTAGDTIDVVDLGLPEMVIADSERIDDEMPIADAASLADVQTQASVAAPASPAMGEQAGELARSAELPSDLAAYLDAVERDILERALQRHRFNRTVAGASLGLSLRQMRYRMARLGVRVGEHGFSNDADRSRGDGG